MERAGSGESNRKLSLKNLQVDGDSLLFHTINRNKESYAVNLKDPHDLAKVKRLIRHADVLIENFRPGTMDKFGLDYDSVRELNPRLVYGSITGYGKEGPWKDKPGQDLLVQSRSGLPWLNGDAGQPPVPLALSVVDLFTGAHLAQGILACLVRRGRTGKGGFVEVSLLESILDVQFEVLTTHLNDGGKLPQRSAVHNAHAYLGAPYGIYETKDGFIALAMGSVVRLGELLENAALQTYDDPNTWISARDEIKRILAEHMKTKTTREWLDILEPADYWCSDVLTWDQLFAHEGFQVLDMVQEVRRPGAESVKTTRCPIRIDGERLKSAKGSPRVGEDNARIEETFALRKAGKGESS